jgi:CRISPR-associated Csx10 family RAMP protein
LATQLTQVTAMGGSKTRGLGKVRITVSACDRPIPSLPSLQERLEAFNKKFRAEWAFYELVVKAQPLPNDVYFFSLDLLSPAILTWHGIPLTSPTPEMLGVRSGVSLLRAFAGYSVAGGWHMGAKLPRRKQMTVDMGSVFLYRSEGYSLAELADRLGKLETDGLGAERLAALDASRFVYLSTINRRWSYE